LKLPGFSQDTKKPKAIAEYLGLGKYPADVQNRHGNAKITNQEFKFALWSTRK
jgi:hypothetical protein